MINHEIPESSTSIQFDSTRCFTNPWSSETTISDNGIRHASTSESISLGFNSDHSIDNDYKRRKSSIIIPPSRAAGPNLLQNYSQELFARENSIPSTVTTNNDYNSINIDGNGINQSHMLALLLQQGKKSSSSLFKSPVDEFFRRTSLASVNFIPENNHYGNPGSIVKSQKISLNNSPLRRMSTFNQPSSPLMHIPQFSNELLSGEHGMTNQESTIIVPQMKICNSKQDLTPTLNPNPLDRRASTFAKGISPLKSLTTKIITTYALCSDNFVYQASRNPKRILTKPSIGTCNEGYDNENSDYILYVNDILGGEQGRKYLVLDMLGQGTFGQVAKCQNIITKEIVGVKIIKSKAEYLNQSIVEVKFLKLINLKLDPNDDHHFLRLKDTFIHKNHLCLVFELLNRNIYEILKQNRFYGLKISTIRHVTAQLLDSLSVLKNHNIVHCDIKPENILLCSKDSFDVKLIDFGSSCEESRTLFSYIQSRFYRSPEVLLGLPYSCSIDMWSLGCVIAEMLLGIPVFPGQSEFNQLTRIVETVGYPPDWMLDMGKSSSKYFKTVKSEKNMKNKKDNSISDSRSQGEMRKYKLKTVNEYNTEFKTTEPKSKKYFKFKDFDSIVMNAKIYKDMRDQGDLLEQEMKDRSCLLHFLKGILNINPLERWTPQQAMMHPFITGQPFDKSWYPPGFVPDDNLSDDSMLSPTESSSDNSSEGTKMDIDTTILED